MEHFLRQLRTLALDCSKRVDLETMAIILVHPSSPVEHRRTLRSPGSWKLEGDGCALAFCPRDLFAGDPRDGRALVIFYQRREPWKALLVDLATDREAVELGAKLCGRA
jgi:hypothetical protein